MDLIMQVDKHLSSAPISKHEDTLSCLVLEYK